MNRVVCPVDFSDHSRVALHVAAQLAIDINVELVAMHIVHYPTAQLEDQSLVLPNVLLSLDDEAATLKSWIAELPVNHSALQFKTIVKIGLLLEELAEVGDDNSIIVSGTAGMDDFFSKLFGSVTREIFNQLKSSLLVIPKTFQYRPFKKICFAADLMSPLKWDVESLLSLAQKWNAHISFLSVLNEDKSIDIESVGESFVHQYLRGEKYNHSTFHLNQADSPVQGIKKFTQEHKSDLLVLTHKDRSFWTGLFEKSVSGEFIAHPEIPVLVFHQQVEK